MARANMRTWLAIALATSAVAGAQAPRFTAAPSRPAPGAVVRLSLAPGAATDAIVGVDGSMAGEPLHFLAAGGGTWHALGPIPVDASGRVTARAVIRRRSGKRDTVSVAVPVPVVPPPKAQP